MVRSVRHAQRDAQGSGPPDDDNPLEDMGAFLVKVLGGAAFGPFGLIAGLVAAAAEDVLPHPVGLNVVGTYDEPDPDETPAVPGDGKTVKPAGLALPDGGVDVVAWRAQQGLMVDKRQYDFIVDRSSQVWWPSDDGMTGFRGRWGQRVTSDLLARRAGPKFPDYARMFLLALADGDTRKLLDLNA